MRPRVIVATAVAVLVAVACATSPTGRRQLQLMPPNQIEAMGVQAYREMKEETPTLSSGAASDYARCVADAITRVVPERYAREDWEVTVFRSDQVNAFALPGGKIGVYTGLMKVAETPDQLAAVVGHEVAHVMADHSNERLSTQFAANAGLAVAQIMAGAQSQERQQALALLGLGAQVGVILPFSRTHESEADTIGLDLMARAGFDPRASVDLWQNMAKEGGGGPPEFLSTHPSNQTRIDNLQRRMDGALQTFETARARGRRPDCRRPETIPSG